DGDGEPAAFVDTNHAWICRLVVEQWNEEAHGRTDGEETNQGVALVPRPVDFRDRVGASVTEMFGQPSRCPSTGFGGRDQSGDSRPLICHHCRPVASTPETMKTGLIAASRKPPSGSGQIRDACNCRPSTV